MEAADKWLIRKDIYDVAAGDVLLFRMRAGAVAKHLGIAGCIGAQATFIHAYSQHSVLESALTEPWRRKIAARYRFPTGA
jgi:NlpC/P60 family putative phage cell wall peptidase